MSYIRCLVATALVYATAMLSAHAQNADSPKPAARPVVVDPAAPGAQGMRAYLDPVTGELTSDPTTPKLGDQAASLTLPAPDYSKVTFETRADGSVIAYSNGQFQSTNTITLDPDGNARIGCMQTGDHAQHGHPAQGAELAR